MNREEELIAENEALRAALDNKGVFELLEQLREVEAERRRAVGEAERLKHYKANYIKAEEEIFALRAEAARLRAEAEKSAAQRDEAVLRAEVAEEAKRAVEADLAVAGRGNWLDKLADWISGGLITYWYLRYSMAKRDVDFLINQCGKAGVRAEQAEDRAERAEAELARIRSDRQKEQQP